MGREHAETTERQADRINCTPTINVIMASRGGKKGGSADTVQDIMSVWDRYAEIEEIGEGSYGR